MAKRLNKYAFAPVMGNFCATSCIRSMASESRAALGRLFDDDCEKGWEQARREGYRIQKVGISYTEGKR